MKTKIKIFTGLISNYKVRLKCHTFTRNSKLDCLSLSLSLCYRFLNLLSYHNSIILQFSSKFDLGAETSHSIPRTSKCVAEDT